MQYIVTYMTCVIFRQNYWRQLNSSMVINYGDKIRELRSKKGISQLDLEIKAGFCPGVVSRIETGKVNPSKETLAKIAVALGLSITECAKLFGLNEIANQMKPRNGFNRYSFY